MHRSIYSARIGLAFTMLVSILTQAQHTGAAVDQVVFPRGLAPGAKFEIAFTTASTTTASSSDIAVYNNFVTSEAYQNGTLASLNVNWRVIGSTDSVSALSNAPSFAGMPVYNTAGKLITSAGLYNDPVLDNTLGYDQNGAAITIGNSVWTGSSPSGLVGGHSLGHFVVDTGDPYALFGEIWLNNIPLAIANNSFSLYALSDPITVPEPSSVGLFVIATIGLVQRKFRNR